MDRSIEVIILQKKGTRSASRRLKAISGRERRLKADATHVVPKRIVQSHPHSLIGLEDLTHIRERTHRKKGQCRPLEVELCPASWHDRL
jgi:hypothetical protein